MSEKNILEIFQGAAKNLCNSVLDQVQDAVVWLDKDRKVVYWNKAAELMSGIEGAHILGKACFEEPALFVDFGGVNICRDKCPVAMTLKDGAPRTLDVYLQHKQGFRMPASLRIIPVLKEDGEI
ncbi:MAG: PAS domain-containing protein, partial [Candidatus Aminicenantes bacterium]